MNTKNPKIIGLLTAWGAEDWTEPAIKQSLEYCDEVIVSVGAHAQALQKFEDSTYSICMKYPEVTLLAYSGSADNFSRGRCTTLNKMLKESRLYSVGNWIWLLDVDEFYPKSGYLKIREAIKTGRYDFIEVEEEFFLVNMQRYLKGSHGRLWKIKVFNMFPFYRFKPTNVWKGSRKKIYTLPRDYRMFHYSLLTNPHMRKVQWENEYPNSKQTNKTRWLDEIYRYYDLDNEDYWIEKNLELTGIKSPWFGRGRQPDENGRLFKYGGKHPKFIEETNLPKISDFRKKYGFE